MGGGVESLVRAYPDSVACINRATGLYPFMSAAATTGDPDDATDLNTVYSLLKFGPHVMNCHFERTD